MDSAEMVCALPPISASAVLGLVASLADRSLVVVHASELAMRYRLLETVREFAAERLKSSDENSAIRERHASWYAGLADLIVDQLDKPGSIRWLQRLSDDYENFHSALEWLLPSGGNRVLAVSAWGEAEAYRMHGRATPHGGQDVR